MVHEQIPNWELSATVTMPEDSIFPLLASTQSNVTAPQTISQMESYSDILKILDLDFTSQEHPTPNYIPTVPEPGPDPQPRNRKRKNQECESSHKEEETETGTFLNKKRQYSGLCAAENHKMFERRRRDRITQRMKALQELLPDCSNKCAASVLDKSIDYIKTLQQQIQNMCLVGNLMHYVPPVQVPQISPYFPIINVGNDLMMGTSTNLPWSAGGITSFSSLPSATSCIPHHQILNPMQQMPTSTTNMLPFSYPLNFPTGIQDFVTKPVDYNPWSGYLKQD